MVSTRAVRTLEDLLKKTRRTRLDCIEWMGAKKDRGYGVLQYKGRKVLAHRLAAHLSTGFDLSSNSYICHRCDNPACINPNHLYVGDAASNGRDRLERGTGITYYRVTFEQMKIIHDLTKRGIPLEDMERIFSIKQSSINKLISYLGE